LQSGERFIVTSAYLTAAKGRTETMVCLLVLFYSELFIFLIVKMRLTTGGLIFL
jgi:hypothetical protein